MKTKTKNKLLIAISVFIGVSIFTLLSMFLYYPETKIEKTIRSEWNNLEKYTPYKMIYCKNNILEKEIFLLITDNAESGRYSGYFDKLTRGYKELNWKKIDIGATFIFNANDISFDELVQMAEEDCEQFKEQNKEGKDREKDLYWEYRKSDPPEVIEARKKEQEEKQRLKKQFEERLKTFEFTEEDLPLLQEVVYNSKKFVLNLGEQDEIQSYAGVIYYHPEHKKLLKIIYEMKEKESASREIKLDISRFKKEIDRLDKKIEEKKVLSPSPAP